MPVIPITLNNTTNIDNKIIQNNILGTNPIPSISTKRQEDLFKSIKKIVQKIKKGSKRIKSLKIIINREPKLDMSILFSYKNLFFSPLDYYYLKKPNTINTQFNYSLINNHLNHSHSKKSIIKENQLSIGLGVSPNIDKYNCYIKNQTLTNSPFELEIIMQNTKQISKAYHSNKTSAKVNAYYNLINRPFAFRDYLPYDNINWFKLQLCKKNTFNDNNNHSNNLKHDFVSNDKQLKAKASFEYNKQNEVNFNWVNIKISNSLVSCLHSLYSQTNLFIRKTINMKHLLMQFNFEGQNRLSLTKNELNQHEKIQVNTFRGLENSGGIQALNHYFLFSSKLYSHSFRTKSEFNLERDDFMVNPFAHLNVLITNNQSMRISSGIGVSIITKLFSFEVLYTPYFKRDPSDIHSLFQIKLGID